MMRLPTKKGESKANQEEVTAEEIDQDEVNRLVASVGRFTEDAREVSLGFRPDSVELP